MLYKRWVTPYVLNHLCGDIYHRGGHQFLPWCLVWWGFSILKNRNHNLPPAKTHHFFSHYSSLQRKQVILNSVNSLPKQQHGRHHTAQIVALEWMKRDRLKDAGAEVITTPEPQCGKANAIQYVLDRTDCVDDRYVIIDADNGGAEDICQRWLSDVSLINWLISQSSTSIVQWQLDFKKASAAYHASSRCLMKAKSFARQCVVVWHWYGDKRAVIRDLWAKVQTQTEDIELNGLLSLHYNAGVEWVSQAVFYDEKPDRIFCHSPTCPLDGRT